MHRLIDYVRSVKSKLYEATLSYERMEETPVCFIFPDTHSEPCILYSKLAILNIERSHLPVKFDLESWIRKVSVSRNRPRKNFFLAAGTASSSFGHAE